MKKKAYISWNWLVFLIIIILILFAFNLFSTATIIQSGGTELNPEIYDVKWNDIDVEIETTHKGSLTSGGTIPPSSTKITICGDNDGKINIGNDYDAGQFLTLKSSISGNKRGCGGNYITAKMIIPKGTLTGNCKLSSSESATDGSRSSCQILGLSYKRETCDQKDPVYYNGVYPSQGCLNNIPASVNDYFRFDIPEPTEIEVRLSTDVGNSGSSSASMSLEFLKDPHAPNQEGEETQETSPRRISVWERINLWIDNLIKSIFGWF